jgi:hypothetical protein
VPYIFAICSTLTITTLIKRRVAMKRLSVLVACLLLLSTSAYSKQKKKTTGQRTTEVAMETSKKQSSDDWLNVEIISSERVVIKQYFEHNPQAGHKVHKSKRLPPGLQKKAARGCDLPPGWQKKLGRGEVLDVTVYQQAERLPVELIRRLPPAPEGTVLIKVEGKVVRLYEATRTIIDVFDIGT